MLTATKKNKSGFFIGVTCPGCGGKLEIESDFFVLTCHHCGSVLRLQMPDIPPAYIIKSELPKREIRFHVDRYLKKQDLPLTGSGIDIRALYYPYWKIDAIVLKVRNTVYEKSVGLDNETNQEITVEQPMTDIRLTPYTATMAAGNQHEGIPHSIGMRTEYLKLWPFSEENNSEDFDTFPVQIGWNDILERLDKTMFALGNLHQAEFGKNITEYFRPRGALVYFPYYVVQSDYKDTGREFIVDGVSGRIIKYNERRLFEDLQDSGRPTLQQFGQLGVDFHRCRTCGCDLPGEPSAVYICRNCHELTVMGNTGYPLNKLLKVDTECGPDDRLFPFWSFRISSQDAARLKPMFGGMFDSDRLVVPAFRVPNFEAMYRLSRRISMTYPRFNLVPVEVTDGKYVNVSLPLTEALLLADIIIYREEVGRGLRQKKGDTDFRPMEVSLFFAPFHKQSYFYVDSLFEAVTFEKNMVDSE